MPFIPHSDDDVKAMLSEIGVDRIEDLFDEIPKNLRVTSLPSIPESLTEMELARLMKQRAALDSDLLCMVGAGSYEHHIPAAVLDMISRGEFLTAYTPYQAEASQGTLQLLYEYQTMMASLMGLDVSNGSLYEGASSLAEAILMSVRLQKGKHHPRILLPRTVHPHYRQVVKTIVTQQNIEIIEIPFDLTTGLTDLTILEKYEKDAFTALVIPQPNFFGCLEDVDALTDWAHEHHAFAIGVVNPLAMSLLKPPGMWGKTGADIACGEGQSLGVPMASGGPYYGFLCCKKEFVRQLPGRIVGQTVDAEGKRGFVLTLQAREQHIRRAKATSNICTNQGLLVTASTVYMSLLGPNGLRQVATVCHQNLMTLRDKIKQIPNIEFRFNAPHFHECVLQLPISPAQVLKELAKEKIQGGLFLDEYYPELKNCMLVCTTETKTESDLNRYALNLKESLSESKFTDQQNNSEHFSLFPESTPVPLSLG